MIQGFVVFCHFNYKIKLFIEDNMKNKRERVKQQLSLAPEERDEYFNPKKYQFPDLKTIIFFLFGGLIALLAIMIINS
ncbi:MAG: hypothetical protein CBE24_02530 [bacterium TMED264]|nr:MAG: hypothetical protein CBE24_02530 [bacterium TMED264]